MPTNPFVEALKALFLAAIAVLVFLTFWQRTHLEDQVARLSRDTKALEDRVGETGRKVDELKARAGSIAARPTNGEGPAVSSSESGALDNAALDAKADPSKPVGTPGRYKNFLSPDPDPAFPEHATKFMDGDLGEPYSAEPKGFNPITEQDASLTDLIIRNCGDAPANRHWKNPDLWGPGLCWRVEVSPDYTEWTLFFRKDAVWQTPLVDLREYPHLGGTHRVTAKDYKFTIDMLTNPQHDGSSIRSYYTDVEGCELIGEHVAVLRWKKTLWHSISFTLMEDRKVVPEFLFGFDEKGKPFPPETIGQEFNNHFMNRKGYCGCGPYRMSEFKSGEVIVLDRFEDWYGTREGLRYPIRRKRLYIYNDPETVLLKLKAGEIDLCGLRPTQYRKEVLENTDPTSPFKDGRIVTWKSPRARFAYFGWKNTHPLFRQRDVRKALALACNRHEMAEKIFGGSYMPMGAPIYHGSKDFDPAIKPLPFDLEAAKALLDGAGWKMNSSTGLRENVVDGATKPFEFTLIWPAPSPEFEAMLNQYKNDLLSIGVKMNPSPMQWGVFQKKIHDREFEAMTLQWVEDGWEHDFDQIWHSRQIQEAKSSNMIEFSNPELDRLSDDLRGEMDREKRTQKVRRIGRILYEEQPYCFFGWQTVFIANRTFVKNAQEHGYKIRPFLRTWPMWIEK